MKLPLATSAMTFFAVAPPEPVKDFETKQPRTDESGAPLFSTQLVALFNGEAEVIPVKVAGDPGPFEQGTPLRVTGLMAQPWTMGDRSGISYRAEKIEALNVARKAS
jgi:hypothetical protein